MARASANRPASVWPTTAPSRPATRTETCPPGRTAWARAATTATGIVDLFQQVMAQHQIGLPGRHHVRQEFGICLHAGDPVGDPGVLGPAVQDREGVRRRVDDGDQAAVDGQRNCPGAAATADVDDPGRRIGPGSDTGTDKRDQRQIHRVATDLAALFDHRTPPADVPGRSAPPRPGQPRNVGFWVAAPEADSPSHRLPDSRLFADLTPTHPKRIGAHRPSPE